MTFLKLGIAFVAFCGAQSFSGLHAGTRQQKQAGRTILDSTFRFLQWRGEEARGSLGTVLLLTDEFEGKQRVIAVTAKHVLEAFKEDYATVEMRGRDAWGTEVLVPCEVKIREHGAALYAVHSTADVAAFRIGIPDYPHIALLARSNWLATDQILHRIELRTGNTVYELGFPFGVAANSVGYPILRSGALASYPVLPLGRQQLLADIPAFESNSGGPVYVEAVSTAERSKSHPWILGIVSAGLNSTITHGPEPLGISVIVPAIYMRDTINLLPHDAATAVCGAVR